MSPWDKEGIDGNVRWAVTYIGDYVKDWRFGILVEDTAGNKYNEIYEVQRVPMFGLDVFDTVEINKILDELFEKILKK
ncbi:hypothetical protein FLAPJACK_157 [Bacillus phage Flapjack]|uniref:Uncharacterized protein n=1 Tax=Bacillus phage Flapjack TaxID=1983465 RepID=A0A1X9SG85_9CAUD|nr:hypothetical protein FLAPJACK_157 [Bacillus phage Flapjack]